MSIFLFLLIVIIAISAFCFRTQIAAITVGVSYLTAGVFARMWPALKLVIIIALIVGFVGWVMFIALTIGIGVYANSPWSALTIVVLFPLWFLAFIMPPFVNKVWIFGPVVRIVRIVFSPILIAAVIFLFVGIWSPAVKGSLNRWAGNSKQAVANSFDKNSVQSEAEAGTFGSLPEETWVYNEYGQPFRKLPQGTLVRMLNLNGVPVQPDSEGLAQVMLPNETGDFIKGNTGYVPSRKIDWDWKGARKDVEPKKQEKQKSVNPFWKESIHANYAWTDENQGAVKIGTFEAGSYNLKVSSNFKFEEMKDGQVVAVVPIGPKGLVGRIVATQSQLPIKSAPFGARLVKVGDGPWQLLGEKTTIHLSEKSDVYVTINMRRIPDNFHNQGGDDITIKRSW